MTDYIDGVGFCAVNDLDGKLISMALSDSNLEWLG